MIIAIRISGMIKIPKAVDETLHRMRLRRKYSAVILKDTPENKKLLKSVRNYVAYGPIAKETLQKLVELRAQATGKEIDTGKVVAGIGTQSWESLGIKPFFRLHPPRGGIESKKHFGVGKGVLGDNKEKINDLVLRML